MRRVRINSLKGTSELDDDVEDDDKGRMPRPQQRRPRAEELISHFGGAGDGESLSMPVQLGRCSCTNMEHLLAADRSTLGNVWGRESTAARHLSKGPSVRLGTSVGASSAALDLGHNVQESIFSPNLGYESTERGRFVLHPSLRLVAASTEPPKPDVSPKELSDVAKVLANIPSVSVPFSLLRRALRS